jgi:hypothetical protein
MWATCPSSVSSGYHAEFHEGCYQKHTNPLNCWISSSDFSGYHMEFNEGHGIVGECQERGTPWQGNGMGAALHVLICLYSLFSHLSLPYLHNSDLCYAKTVNLVTFSPIRWHSFKHNAAICVCASKLQVPLQKA